MITRLPLLGTVPGPDASSLRTEAMTPFVPTLRAELDALVRDLLVPGEGTEGVLDWRLNPAPPGSPWSMVVRVSGVPPMDALELDLWESIPARRAWFNGRWLALSYRRGRDGRDPMDTPTARARLESLRDRVATRDAHDSTFAAAIRTQVDRLHAFANVRDAMYRQVSPREVVIRLGFRCNQRCHFCWQDRAWPDAPTALYTRWVDETAAAGRAEVCFSGGEPTIHPDLMALMDRASHQHGLRVRLQTNAVRLAQPAFLSDCITAGLSEVFVSFHAPDATTSDAMTLAPGTHVRTVSGILACLAAGLRVTLNCVVERQNHDLLAAHARMIVDRFVRPFPQNPVALVVYSHPGRYHDAAAWRQGMVPLDTLRPHLLEAVQTLRTAGVSVEGLGTCGFPPCLFRDTPEALWGISPGEEDTTDRAGRTYGTVCTSCAVRPGCLGLRREYLEAFGDRGLVPFTQAPAGFLPPSL